MNEDFSLDDTEPHVQPDVREEEAVVALERLFDEHRERVFFSRQLEVLQKRSGSTGSPTARFVIYSSGGGSAGKSGR